MSRNPYLFRRGNIFYCRVVVPSNLRQILNKTEICYSLNTQDKKTALPLCLDYASQIKTFFNSIELTSTMATNKLPDLMARKKNAIRKDLEHERLQAENEALKSRLQAEINKAKASALDEVSSLRSEIKGIKAHLKPVSPGHRKKVVRLGTVVRDFLERYDKEKVSMRRKLGALMPLFLNFVGDKPIGDIDVATLNRTHSLKYVKGGLCQNESRKTENIYGRI